MPKYACGKCQFEFISEPDKNGAIQCPHCNEQFIVNGEDIELSAGSVLNGFEIQRLIGTGGMGHVYLATQISMQRSIALKVLHSSLTQDAGAVRQFMDEARNAGKIQHPNIVSAIDTGEANGLYYIAMQYVPGETLESKMNRGKFVSVEDAMGYALQIGDALKDIWDKSRMYHKDIKPGNIIINEENEAMLLDMGIAQRIGDSSVRNGNVEGSPFYMSPEQVKGEKLDWSTDLYSLGATLFHILVGQPPYNAPDIQEIVRMHVSAPFPDPTSLNPNIKLPVEVTSLLRKMMEKEKENRFSSWDEFISVADMICRKLRNPMSASAKRTGPVTGPISGPVSGPISKKVPKVLTVNRTAPVKKSHTGSIIAMVNLVVFLTIGIIVGIYFWSKNNTYAAQKAFNEAAAYVSQNDYSVDEARRLLAIAKNLSDKYGVDEKLKKDVASAFVKIKVMQEEVVKETTAAGEQFAVISEKIREAKEALAAGEKLFKEKKDDEGNYKKARELLDEADSLIAKVDVKYSKNVKDLENWKYLCKSQKKHLEGYESYKEKYLAIMQKRNEAGEASPAAEPVAEKPAAAAEKETQTVETEVITEDKFKAILEENKNSMRFNYVSAAMKHDFAGASAALKKTEAYEAGKAEFKKLCGDFDKWLAVARKHARLSEEMWKGIYDSKKELGGTSIVYNDKKMDLFRIKEDRLFLVAGAVNEEVHFKDLPQEDMAAVSKSAVEKKRLPKNAVAPFLAANGAFKDALANASDDADKMEISATAKAYIKNTIKKVLEENPSDKAEILRKLKKDYESLSEYATAVKEIKAETAAAKKPSENGSN